jgi:HEPN domain-containing protein
MMHRHTLQRLALLRIHEARLLMENGLYSGSYYLAGYAVECGIKAILSSSFRENAIPNKDFVNKIHTHDFEKLLREAGLEGNLRETLENRQFKANWEIVKNWKPDARYQLLNDNPRIIFEEPGDGRGTGGGAGSADGSGYGDPTYQMFDEGRAAFDLVNAIQDNIDGVMPWLKRFW